MKISELRGALRETHSVWHKSYYGPYTRRVTCTCGWSVRIVHRNALARKAKAIAAEHAHLLEMQSRAEAA